MFGPAIKGKGTVYCFLLIVCVVVMLTGMF